MPLPAPASPAPRPPPGTPIGRAPRAAAAIAALLLCGCDHGKRAVEACEALAEELRCGDTDFLDVLNCDQYASAECELGPYFDCLDESFTCVGGVASFTSGDCAALSTCD
jgi:hypothetical protein